MRTMRNRLVTILAISTSVVGLVSAVAGTKTNQFRALQPAGGLSTDPSRLFAQIVDSEYDIRWCPDLAVYYSPCRSQNLRFEYLGDGFSVKREEPASISDDWQIT